MFCGHESPHLPQFPGMCCNCGSLETEENEIVSDNLGSLKRGKNSRFSSKSGRKSLKKLKELDVATKTVNIYQSFDTEEELKTKILYKAFRRHKNFLLCFFLAPGHSGMFYRASNYAENSARTQINIGVWI